MIGGGSALPSTVADCLPAAGIDFGYCGIHKTATRTVTLINPYFSGIVKFEIATDNCPFTISALSGKGRKIGCFILKQLSLFLFHFYSSCFI